MKTGWQCLGMVCVFVLVGNSLVLVSIVLKPNIIRRVSNRFIFSLMVADLLVGAQLQ